MLTVFLAIFLVLHGLVHLLYAGQSWRLFELRPNMIWPDDFWLLSKLMSKETVRVAASISPFAAALGFAAGGVGLLLQADWRWSAAAISAGFSTLLLFVFWNGKSQALSDQGGVGLLINIAIVVVIVGFNLPA